MLGMSEGQGAQALLEPFFIPEQRFKHVHVDLVGLLPPSHGFTHLLAMADRTTSWMEVMPLFSSTMVEVARAFLSTWVAHFGTSIDLTSDRRVQFVSELWTAVAASLGIQLQTVAYNPQANGCASGFTIP